MLDMRHQTCVGSMRTHIARGLLAVRHRSACCVLHCTLFVMTHEIVLLAGKRGVIILEMCFWHHHVVLLCGA